MLAAGTRLGPYEILEPLGAGGMGEVYKGRDTRLERTVAVKILSASLTNDPTWRQRFDREARVLAALSNPHICPVFDVGSQDQVDFLVMECLEGETLAARLARGPLPVDLALRHAVEIADALAAAHSQGVSHRDLKPGNIMLTKSGARLLDFGLARLGPPLSSHPPDQPTRSSGLTEKGTILGTVQYMAPEQLGGKETDARTDIFAFGAVVHEMVTGRKAFEGQSQASLIAAILEHDPVPMSSVQLLIPPALDRVVRKCLNKDPEERWQNARDLRDELKWIAEGSSQAGVPVTVAPRRRWRALLSLALIAILSVALLTLAVLHLRERPAEASRVVFSVARPHGALQYPLFAPAELAPNGKHLVFLGLNPDGRSVLRIRSLDSLTDRPLVGTENSGPLSFWAPDGRSVGFFADGKLKTIEISGGPARTLADAPDTGGGGGSWSSQGAIIFLPRPGPLYRVSADGGPATPLLALEPSRHEISHASPHFLPDGRHFLYAVASADAGSSGVYVGSLHGEEPRLLIRAGSKAVYSPPGHVVFSREQTLFVQPFDLRSMQITGQESPIPGPDGQAISTLGGVLFSVSHNGVLAYVRNSFRDVQLTQRDRSGNVLGSIGEPASYTNIVLSPDEKRLILERAGQTSNYDLWLLERASGISTRVTFGGFNSDAAWSPDGRQLIYAGFTGAANELYRTVIGRGDSVLFFKSGENKYPQQWSNDGTSILFIDLNGRSLYRLPVSGGAKPEKLLGTAFAKDEFRVSPDGRWIAYNSLESGRWEIYVASFPSFGDKRQMSSGGGCQPLWRKDGKELFYLDLQGKLMAVDVVTGTSFEAGVPRLLFQTPITVNPVIDQYAVTGDGQRFIMGMPVGEEEPITVMLNWTAGLKR